eukprot:scaffold21564_cov123-Isochrysis_galbana.AAC.2
MRRLVSTCILGHICSSSTAVRLHLQHLCAVHAVHGVSSYALWPTVMLSGFRRFTWHLAGRAGPPGHPDLAPGRQTWRNILVPHIDLRYLIVRRCKVRVVSSVVLLRAMAMAYMSVVYNAASAARWRHGRCYIQHLKRMDLPLHGVWRNGVHSFATSAR